MVWTRLAALIVKELLAAFRDPRGRMALVVPPLIQLFLFAYAATLEVSNVPIGVVNQDWGAQSTQLVSRLQHASAFSEVRLYDSEKAAQAAMTPAASSSVPNVAYGATRSGPPRSAHA